MDKIFKLLKKLGQKGVIAPSVIVVVILLAGLAAGLILVRQTQIFKPKAGEIGPTTAQVTSLSGQTQLTVGVGYNFRATGFGSNLTRIELWIADQSGGIFDYANADQVASDSCSPSDCSVDYHWVPSSNDAGQHFAIFADVKNADPDLNCMGDPTGTDYDCSAAARLQVSVGSITPTPTPTLVPTATPSPSPTPIPLPPSVDVLTLSPTSGQNNPYQPGQTVTVNIQGPRIGHFDGYYIDATTNPNPTISSIFTLIPVLQGQTTSSFASNTYTWQVPTTPGRYYFVVNAHTKVFHDTNDWTPSLDTGCAWDGFVYTGPSPLTRTSQTCTNPGKINFWIGTASVTPSASPGVGTYSQSSYTPTYSQASYTPTYSQSSYTPTYSQASYTPTYSQSSYTPTYSQASYTPTYSQGSYTTNTSPAPGVATTHYRFSDNPATFSPTDTTAGFVAYTIGGVNIRGYAFSDPTPGAKTIYVDYKQSDDTVIRRQASITVAGIPVITSCDVDAGTGANSYTISGTNFGDSPGVVVSGSTNFTIVSWSPTAVRTSVSNAISAQSVPITLTSAQGLPTTGACSASSPLAIGAQLFCPQVRPRDITGVELTIVEARSGGQTFRETVTLDKNGVAQGIRTRLTAGQGYKLAIKVPRGVRKVLNNALGGFIAQTGTTNVDFVRSGSGAKLPLGDIAPTGVGDGVINAADFQQLRTDFAGGKATQNSYSDLNLDTWVNSFEWACMRPDFGSIDDPLPQPGPLTITASPSPSQSAAPSPSP